MTSARPAIDGSVRVRRSPIAERSALRAHVWRATRNQNHLYRVIVGMKNDDGGRQFVDRSTSIVIDGFERSGNTFAYLAFLDGNPEIANVGHHTHSPAQFHFARRWGVPAVLLVRDPRSVALSVHLRWPARSLGHVLEDYQRFHRRVLRDHESVVIAPFETVTTDFGQVIERVNGRFGTAFDRYVAGPAADGRVFSAIEARNRLRFGQLAETAVARPSPVRRAASEALSGSLREPGVARRLEEAEALYARALELVG